MNNETLKNARMILAGLAAVPALAATSESAIAQSYCYAADSNSETETTGLCVHQQKEAKVLVDELNQLDVIKVDSMVITAAPRIPYGYNLPDEEAVEAARLVNIDRLIKLRKIIEAAK